MNTLHAFMAALSLAALLVFFTGPATAGEGHDHGDSAPAPAGPALPRFAAASEAFELVGVLDGRQLTLYLDRFGDNTPVPGAQIELDIAGRKFKAEPHGEAIYEVVLPEAPRPGVLPVTATVVVGQEADLLAGELDLHEDPHAEAAAPALPWQRHATWGGVAVAAALLLAVALRRLRSRRLPAAGGAA